MQDSIFRLYDIRGRVGSELLIEKVYELAQSMATYFNRTAPGIKKIAVAVDGRLHSNQIKSELCRGFLDSGFDVVYIGVCPTPVLYFSQHDLDVDAGVMITASHNGKDYNGFKICMLKNTVWGSEILKIRDIFKSGNFEKINNQDSNITGNYSEIDGVEIYINWLAENFKNLCDKKISVLIDCANGATGAVLPRLIKKMNLKSVGLLYEEVDGNYPNHEADPVIVENMTDLKDILGVSSYKFGIGFDGDGDRMAAMTQSGYLVPGDKLLAVFAQSILRKNGKSNIVFDIKCSQVVARLMRSWGANAIMSPSGHSIIKHYMRKESAVLGGELSCHFFFADRYFGYDDGIYAALRLFEILQESNLTLDEHLEVIPENYTTSEIRIECAQEVKEKIIDDIKFFCNNLPDSEILTLDGVLVTTPYGRGLVRGSNTQSVICFRFESDTSDGLEHIKTDFYDQLKKHLSSTNLKTFF